MSGNKSEYWGEMMKKGTVQYINLLKRRQGSHRAEAGYSIIYEQYIYIL
jgi:hypothetical protein